jgi:LysM repeat protein
MISRMTALLTLSILAVQSFAQREVQLRYIEQFKEIALREMERAGIPASIKLAQGLLESNAGQSYLAVNGNNHFGIKCANDWTGRKVYRQDDDRDERGQLIESCFRSYKDAEESFVAHSEFLRDPNKRTRYGDLFLLDRTDYKGWAEGLRRAGYATDPRYPAKLIEIIERYQLNRFDQMSTLELIADIETPDRPAPSTGPTTPSAPSTATPPPAAPFKNNDVRFVLARAGETPAQIARQTNVRLNDIINFNEGYLSADQRLAAGAVVYLQPKRNAYRGKETWHYVKKGETMHAISQMYGVKLDRLYRRNRLTANSQPGVGERIKLKGRRVNERPLLSSETPEPGRYRPAEVILDQDGDHFLDMGDDFIMPPQQPREPRPEPPTVLPQPPAQPQTAPQPQPGAPQQPTTPTPTNEVYHTVVTGDTLFSLARRYNTTVDEIKRLNNLNSNTINIDMKLRVQ